ncbi:MAG: amidohydrolase family protein [Actinomycetota bacterium]|nr:amidohydrolase family protein [Actinomycetota bacterium]
MDGPDDDLRPEAVARRRFLLSLGFGAGLIALGRRLPGRSAPTAVPAAVPTTAVPAVPRSTTSQPPSTTSTEAAAPTTTVDDHLYDLVVAGGRVVDPESGFDAVANLGIDGDTVSTITDGSITGRRTLNARGLVVAPGFVDVLSYPVNGYGEWNKVADGVTSNLCMHGIDGTMERFLARSAGHAPPVNFGGATDQYEHRKALDIGIDYATDDQIDELLRRAEADLRAGALGIHQQPEYTVGVTLDEMLHHGELASRYGVPLCLHLRHSENLEPGTQEEAVAEAVTVARRTGCAVHVEHINSTGGTGRMSDAVAQIEAARADGLAVTACTYPYTYWATYAGSARFDQFREKYGITVADLQVAGTTGRLDEAGWQRARAENRLTAAFAMSDEDIETALTTPWILIGSDAILQEHHNNHPRASGCFSRVLGHYVRERGLLSLPDALAKMTILPARLLEPRCPDLARRGRLSVGAAADVTVFDPATIEDRSTIEKTWLPSVGVHHVVISGQVVREAGTNDRSVRPGIPLLTRIDA